MVSVDGTRRLQKLRESGARRDSSLPGLSKVDQVDAVRASLPQVGFHVDLEILRAQVALS